MKGKMLIVSAPSGSGKSTIVQWLMQEHPELKLYFSISCTSRAPRGTEQNGVEYFFLTPEEFKAKIQNNEFLEYEEVYENRFYGTLKQQVENQREAGQNVVFDVDVKGGVNIKKYYGDEALSLFIQPPSVEELRRRLEGRARDDVCPTVRPRHCERRLGNCQTRDITHRKRFPWMKKVAIFGGSFNPIHTGHIALAQAVQQQCGLDEVWLMVSPQNPLKRNDADLLDDSLRFEMAQKALEGVEGVKACDYEFHLPKPSYTWNTLQHLTKDYPDYTFTLLIGGDNWAHFQRWRHWKDILWHHDVIVYPRDEYQGTISVPLLNVSSTEIRKRVRAGQSISGLVPACIVSDVENYYK